MTSASPASGLARHDWRLAPLAAASWLGCLAGTSGWRPSLVTAAGIALALGLVASRSRATWLWLAIVTLVVMTLASGARSWQLHEGPVAALATDRSSGHAEVRIRDEPVLINSGGRSIVLAHGQLTTLRIRDRALATDLPVTLFGDDDPSGLLSLRPGATHWLGVRLAPAEQAAAEAAVLSVTSVSVEQHPPGLFDIAVTRIHEGLRQATMYSPSDQAALVPSLVVGDRSRISPELTAQFRDTALSHLLAVSGSNLTLMLGVLLAAARGVGLRGWSIRGVGVAGVAGFVLVCRAEPSVLRAAAMGLVALSAIGLGEDRRSIRNLCLAVLALLSLDPWLARSWGFALSAAACLGITVGAEPLITVMTSWAPRWLAEAVAVPLTAQLATAPLTTAMSGQLSIIGLFANALAGPFVGPATVLGLVAAVTFWVPPLAAAAAYLAGWVVQPILWLAQLGSAAPRAVAKLPPTWIGVAASIVLVAAVAVLVGRGLRSRLAAIGMAGALLAAAWVRPGPVGWPGDWQVVFCDVGQGDATVLRAGPGAGVLVDTGPEPGPTLACLDALGIAQIPMLVLTHYHADHVGGTEAVISRYRPGLVLVSPLASPVFAAEAVAQSAEAHQVGQVVAEPGQRFSIGAVQWTTVAAWQPESMQASGEGESATENDSSIIAVVEVAGLRVLLPGDAEPDGQAKALKTAEQHGIDLSAHVLKLPHHGSSRQDRGFLAASGAGLAVASSGQGNSYGHPSPRTLQTAESLGMSIARTDEDGSIAVELVDGRLHTRFWHP
ncbi:MAG: ComEC/Rec2 family competence protein [Propionibacteriaceae bacterium]|nr:ComEC/Rec2 family competence protein [Propionibacteriaceae bacterium]